MAVVTSIILFTAFLVFILINLKYLPRSISASYYLFKKDIWFVIGTFLYGAPLVFAEPFLIQLAGVFILLVAAAPAGRDDGLEGVMHVAGAWLAILCGVGRFIVIGIDGDILTKVIYWSLAVLFIMFSLYAKNKPIKKHTAIIEIIAIYLFTIGHEFSGYF